MKIDLSVLKNKLRDKVCDTCAHLHSKDSFLYCKYRNINPPNNTCGKWKMRR